jgi:FKBP-type peptidyl-prolyl cis-trans isomerase (trigger factor)
VVPTVRLGNYSQISRKTVIVSMTEEAVDKAGRKSEMGYQVWH